MEEWVERLEQSKHGAETAVPLESSARGRPAAISRASQQHWTTPGRLLPTCETFVAVT